MGNIECGFLFPWKQQPKEEDKNEGTTDQKYADIGLLDRFLNWFNSPEPQPIYIPGGVVIGERIEISVDHNFFKELQTRFQSLSEEHIDCYLDLLSRRMLENPSAYQSGATLCYHTFATSLLETCLDWNEGDFQVSLPADVEFMAAAWTPETIAYTVWCVNDNHWVVVVMSIPEWSLTVYDCKVGTGSDDDIYANLGRWSKFMRVVLCRAPRCRDLPQMKDPYKPEFIVNRLDHRAVPQMIISGDCGVYALKHIEHMILRGANLQDVKDENIEKFRKKMCVDLFNQVLAV